MSPVEMGATTRVALERLLEVAQGSDAQARRTADFLLAWWDPDLHGGFALSNLWDMDDDVSRACVLVFAWIAVNRADPRQVGYGPQFEALFAGMVENSGYGQWISVAAPPRTAPAQPTVIAIGQSHDATSVTDCAAHAPPQSPQAPPTSAHPH